jgi:RNA polymerase sigma-70 factor (ECF subfamily)
VGVMTELVSRARAGDRDAFDLIAARSVDRLFAIARLSLRDADLAEDATQETLVRAWRDLPTLRDVERFDAWLYRLLMRACTDAGRARRRWQAGLTLLHAEPVTGDRSREVADRDELDRGLRRLPIEQRTLLVLRFYADLSVPEIAEIVGVPAGTVKSRLHYAMEALRAALDADARNTGATREDRTA